MERFTLKGALFAAPFVSIARQRSHVALEGKVGWKARRNSPKDADPLGTQFPAGPSPVPPGITVEQVDADTLRFHGTIPYTAQSVAGTEGWETSLYAESASSDYAYDAFSWQVNNTNRPPTAVDDLADGDTDSFAETGQIGGSVIANDTDPDLIEGDWLTVTKVNGSPSNVGVSVTGILRFHPD
jgi:Bacterial cadherin-like domain